MGNEKFFLHRVLFLAACIAGVLFMGTLHVQAASAAVSDYSAVFDPEYYYNAYPDIRESIGKDPAALLNHFITTGMREGRQGNASFQVKAYMLNNLDLLPVYGVEDLSVYYVHYICCGQKEGRLSLYQEGMQPAEGVLASFTTKYEPSEERAVNVEQAAARINGMRIAPGETFSFSNSIGERTLENGYIYGPSFAGGRVVRSIGGGICQVSSTMYVTMLLSGITPDRHYFHSLPVDYVPKGLDAAIAAGYKDLTFTNDRDYTIIIRAAASEGSLTVSFEKESPSL